MPTLTTFGAASSRALGHLGGKARKLKSLTFNSSQNWTVPAGITSLASVQGRGSNGEAPGSRDLDYAIISVTYMSSGTAGGGSFDWGSLRAYAEGVVADMNADGAASWTQYGFTVYPDQTNVQDYANSMSDSGNHAGVWGLTGPSSGPATASDSLTMHGSYYFAGSSGQAASAFGLSFAGGVNGAQAALTTHNNVAVTPGQVKFLSIPSGGTIIINYYE